MWAEDSDSDRYLIREALDGTPLGEGVTFARDGQEALREVAKGRPAGIVLDVRMPGMDGLAALRRIRQQHGDVPVVMFSSSSEPEEVLACRELGVLAYALKPVDFQAFRVVVLGVVGHFQRQMETAQAPFIVRLRR